MATFLPRQLERHFTERARSAVIFACTKNKTQPIHLLYALAREKGSLSKNILETHKISLSAIARHCSKERGSRDTKVSFDDDLKKILKKAAQIALKQNQSYIGTEHILCAILYNASKENGISKILGAKKIAQMKKHLDTIFSQNINLSSFPHILKTKSLGDEINKLEKRYKSKKKVKVTKLNKGLKRAHGRGEAQTPVLDEFCENLSALAQERALDPVIGRDKEIARIVNILSRRSKNNPLLIGEPGVGKTAIVQGLAQRINDGEVPNSLLHKNIFSLNLNALIAGTMFRGDFESRMQDILEEASCDNIILFIDEIHTVIGAGAAQGSLDAANILKPALSQGALRCIGATTLDEYKKYIEKDRALERRLQTVIIEEESQNQSVSTLSQLKKLYEKHHEISISDEAVEAAVALSAKYIRDRFLPDKALDVLDEASARLRGNASIKEHTKKIRELEIQKVSLQKSKESAIVKENYQDAVLLKRKEELAEEEIKKFKKKFSIFSDKLVLKKSDIESTVQEMTGIPIQREDDSSKFKKLSIALNKEIIGQGHAVSELINAMKRAETGLAETSRPAGSFLFLGSYGVGKTALAKALAEHNSQKLIRLDMAEYAEPHTISRLIGSPPGYVGYGDGGELTEKIRRYPYSVVLFDEIEKAHPVVHNILLSILEDGVIQDSMSRSVSFKNATIILTSNAGSENAEDRNQLGFSKSSGASHRADTYLEDIKHAIRPEIINRINKIVVFKPLGSKEIFSITKLFVENLKARLPNLRLEVSEEAIKYVAKGAFKPQSGARHIRSAVEEFIEGPLAEYLIRHNNIKNAKIGVRNGKIIVR